MKIAGDHLHERFDRLRQVVHQWELRVAEMQEAVVELFESGDLAGIRALLEEKQRLAERIRRLRHFIEKWENPGFETILGVPKFENDQGREVFQRSRPFRH
ncbi:hypothetical protein [Effusibacillus pohliae]|uniref:hypothetical protein n=1 Tax=Effusibacillus pohliae TaxID=232270 RepID=UPI000361F2A0|nr:hypothetical protein [Effusibacillus pohliae]